MALDKRMVMDAAIAHIVRELCAEFNVEVDLKNGPLDQMQELFAAAYAAAAEHQAHLHNWAGTFGTCKNCEELFYVSLRMVSDKVPEWCPCCRMAKVFALGVK